jgi:PAS domain S-box-containing protein
VTDEELINRFARLRQRISQLRRYADCEPSEAGAVIRQVLEDLQRALDELRVIEEELRLLNDELVMARKSCEGHRRRYRELFDFIPDAYLATDMAGKIREANPAAASVLRAPPESLLGKPLESFVIEPQRQAFAEQVTRLAEAEKIHGWEADFHPVGEFPPVHGRVTAAVIRDPQDRKIGLHWMIHEIG